MNKELNCKIVQDLMQSYLDDVLNEYTREQVEEHMKHCKECSEYCDKLKVYEKLRTDDAEYLRAYQRKMKKWTTIALIATVLISSVLLYLFIPRKTTFAGTYSENRINESLAATDVNIIYTYSIGMELFDKMQGKLVVEDSDKNTLFEHKFKRAHFFPAQRDSNMCFDWSGFMYYSPKINRTVSGNLYIDEEKENLWILADEFEVEACSDEFRIKVLDFID